MMHFVNTFLHFINNSISAALCESSFGLKSIKTKKMKKLLTAILIVAFTLPSCEKDDDLTPNKTDTTNEQPNTGGNNGGGDPGGAQEASTLDKLTAKWWLMKDVKLNGSPITSGGTDIFEWLKDGTHRDNPDGNGNWAHSGNFAFTNSDSTSFTMFTGQANQQLWYITKLTEDSMMVDYTNANLGFFQFTFVPAN